ncbi:MAG TPA: hypothetical protein VLJ39_09720 [Tepidisphaeraceae bacterium]|nr:hypothetical protein [Tepidisphaeraceae bacterium]
MRSNVVWALIALNVILVAGLVAQWLRPNAAVAQAAPRPSDYIIVPATIQGNPAQVLFIIDSQAGALSARSYDGQRMQDMAPIDLNRYFNNKAATTPKKGRGL